MIRLGPGEAQLLIVTLLCMLPEGTVGHKMTGIFFWKKPIAPQPLDFNKAKRTCRFLVIDDEELAIPVEALKRDGYDISQIQEVDSTYMSLCEAGTFDVILLDYNGVAPPQISANDGFGVFERIRSRNPSQYIIAISGKAFDISRAAYLREASDWLKKPASLADTKDKMDRAIRARFDQSLLFEEIKEKLIAQGVPQKSVEKFLADLSNPQSNKLKDYLQSASRLLQNSATVAGLITQIIKATHGTP